MTIEPSTSVVTGASTGIGLATVVRLASETDTVWAAARNPDGAADLQRAIADGGLTNVRPIRLDVDDDASVADAFGQILSDGPVDVLVNNAGVSGAGTVEEQPLAEFRRQMETNVFGLLRCTQAVLPSMRQRGSGAIVNIGSVAGRFVRSGMAAYSASKHAVEAISEALAQEVAPFGVRVVVIEPGVILTPIWTKSEAMPSDTAYPEVSETMTTYFTRTLSAGTPAEAVAEAIASSLAADVAVLRHPVGWDAEALCAGRSDEVSDELIAASARGAAGWTETFSARFFELTPPG